MADFTAGKIPKAKNVSQLEDGYDVSTAISDASTDAEFATAKAVNDRVKSMPGSGDMTKAVYDPANKAGDVFDMDNMVENDTKKVFTNAERSKLDGIQAGAQINHPAASQAEMEAGVETDPRSLSPANVAQAITAQTTQPTSETFTIDAGSVVDKYVTCAHLPDAASVELGVGGAPDQVRGVDFAVDGQRVSWNELGLDGLITIGDVVTVRYDY